MQDRGLSSVICLLASLSGAWSFQFQLLKDYSLKEARSLDRRSITARTLEGGMLLTLSFIPISASANESKTKTKKVSSAKVRETTNGVKFVDVAKGDGGTPGTGDFVVINYVGYLSNGQVFDSQHAKGKKPLAFKVGAKQVIPGLEEALQSMKAGGERQCLVPAALAYGERGVCLPDSKECIVPPNSNVKYDVILNRVAVSPI